MNNYLKLVNLYCEVWARVMEEQGIEPNTEKWEKGNLQFKRFLELLFDHEISHDGN